MIRNITFSIIFSLVMYGLFNAVNDDNQRSISELSLGMGFVYLSTSWMSSMGRNYRDF